MTHELNRVKTEAAMTHRKSLVSKATLTHTSPVEITEIYSDGLFDDCLFFSDDEYAMGEVAAVYEIEIDEDQILEGCDLDFDSDGEQKAIGELVGLADGLIDEYEAFDLLSDSACVYRSDKLAQLSTDSLAGLSWDIQRLQGAIAKANGFAAFKSRDEQGTVYIVPMAGKLDMLRRIR